MLPFPPLYFSLIPLSFSTSVLFLSLSLTSFFFFSLYSLFLCLIFSFPLSSSLFFLSLFRSHSSLYFSLIPLSTSLLFFSLLFLSLLLSSPFPLSNSLFHHSNSPFSLSLLLTFSLSLLISFLLFTYSPYPGLLFLYQYLLLLLFPSPTRKRILTLSQSQRSLNYSAYRHNPVLTPYSYSHTIHLILYIGWLLGRKMQNQFGVGPASLPVKTHTNYNSQIN